MDRLGQQEFILLLLVSGDQKHVEGFSCHNERVDNCTKSLLLANFQGELLTNSINFQAIVLV